MVSSKHAFWQAFVFTVIIFGLGLLLGFFLEDSRARNVEVTLLNSEISFLDEQLRNRAAENFEVDCELAMRSTFNFADKVYEDAVQLEKYDAASKFSDNLKVVHKRYDLLRMVLWTESIEMRKKCGSDYHTIVYLYQYDEDDIQTKALQTSLSRILIDIKEKYSDDVLLIPIAANLDLNSVNLIIEHYNISSIPAIIIDESEVIEGQTTIDEIEKVILESSKE